MKNTFTKISLIVLIASLTACNKGNDIAPEINTIIGNADVQFVNATQHGSINYYFNGKIKQENVGYSSATPFIPISAEMHSIYVTPWRSDNIIGATNYALEDKKSYTIFSIDSLTKAKVIPVVCDRTIPSVDYSKVRFLNFGINSPAIDIRVSNLGTLNNNFSIANRTFNDQELNTDKQSFKEVYYGPYKVEVFLAGTENKVYTTNLTFLKGINYTFYLRGTFGQSGYGIGAVTHN